MPWRLRAGGAGCDLGAPGGTLEFAAALFLCKVQHGAAKKPVRFRLVTAAIGFQPLEDVGIQPHGDKLLRWAVELSDFGGAPIEDRGSVREINVAVFLCGDGVDVALLLFGELPHRLSFRGTRRRVPR